MTINNIQLRAKAALELRNREKEKQSLYQKQIEFYKANPINYFTERLGIRPETIDWLLLPEYKNFKWDGTVNPLKQILDYLLTERKIGVESATGTGKTFFGAAVALWFLECFPNSLVVTAAPKEEQLTLHIWKEITKLYERFGKGTLTSLRLKLNEQGDERLALGFAAGVGAAEESATRAQGFHAEHMLIILEETPGIHSAVITAFQNTCTAPHNIILAFGNPDHQLDNLHKFSMQTNTKHIRISGYDHPNVVLNDNFFVPGAVTKLSLDDMLLRYGDKKNPLYLSRARGLSSAQSADSLIQMLWCFNAVEKDIIENNKTPALGVDVANSEGGDKAAIARGEGSRLIEVKEFTCPDSNQLGKRDVYTLIKEYGINPLHIGVDGIGVGAGTVNALKEIKINVVSLIGSESPIKQKGEEDFNNLRSQMYWQMREDLRNGVISLPNDNELAADLTSPRWFIRNGKICVESKEEIKKRLGRSPNKGDAAVYWNWVRVPRETKNKIYAEIL